MSLKYKLPSGYEIKEIPDAQFDNLWASPGKKMFDDICLFYSPKNVFSKQELADQTKLRDDFGKTHRINLALYHKGKFVGWSWGYQETATVYYMCNSAILNSHRNKGLYTCLMKEMILRAQKQGYTQIYSRHILTNNAIIIAKLKAGFKMTGFELNVRFGTMVVLSYFKNKTQNDILDFRSALKRPDKKMKKIFKL
jgi:ribosomal protein S18 acetylase RimI-like enzyme